jgi:hypothetical protein
MILPCYRLVFWLTCHALSYLTPQKGRLYHLYYIFLSHSLTHDNAVRQLPSDMYVYYFLSEMLSSNGQKLSLETYQLVACGTFTVLEGIQVQQLDSCSYILNSYICSHTYIYTRTYIHTYIQILTINP